MYRFNSFIAATMVAATAVAADYSVTGRLIDSTSEPESFATIRILTASDTTKAVAFGISGDDGEFAIGLDNAGNYIINISSVGKNDLTQPFEVTVDAPVADLGTLIISENSAVLAEVEVTGYRPVVTKEIDRIGYDVQADEDSRTATVQDILRKVPLVTIDADGTIKVKGSTNFKIYKDGRPNNAFTNNAKDIFAAIPAAMIKKIEVITDPGAKEDAEGVGAILNIVTYDNSSVNGVMGNVNMMYPIGNTTPFGNVWLSGNFGKFAMSVNAGYFHQDEDLHKSVNTSDFTFADSGNRQVSTSTSLSKGDMAFWGIDASYELDSLNLFTMEFGGFWYNAKSNTPSSMGMYAPDDSPIYSYKLNTFSPKTSYLEFDGAVNYQHLTHRKGEAISLHYQVSNNRTQADSETAYADMVNFPAPYTGINSCADARFIEHTGQLDWTRPFCDIHTLSTGVKIIGRNNHSTNTSEYVDAFTTHDDFKHVTTIVGAYVDYRATLGKWTGRAGLRYEFSRLSAKFIDGSQDPFAANLSDWVPNASVMYSISDFSAVKAAYATRINRPGINYLNPAVNLTPTSQSSGNPGLESVHYNTFSLNYSLMKMIYNIDITASYDFADNTIASVTTVDPVTDFTSTTYGNIGKTRNLSLSVFLQGSITAKTSLMINATISHNKISLPDISNSHTGFNLFARATQQLPWKLRLEGYAFFGTGSLSSVYAYSDGSWSSVWHGFSLQRTFLKDDRLTVKVEIHNPFNRSVTNTTRFVKGPYTGTSESVFDGSRRVSISVGYRFGSVNASVKKTQHSVSNTDMQGGAEQPSMSPGVGM